MKYLVKNKQFRVIFRWTFYLIYIYIHTSCMTFGKQIDKNRINKFHIHIEIRSQIQNQSQRILKSHTLDFSNCSVICTCDLPAQHYRKQSSLRHLGFGYVITARNYLSSKPTTDDYIFYTRHFYFGHIRWKDIPVLF